MMLLLILSSALTAQVTVESPYLLQPELCIGYVDSCAQFWTQTLDEDRGGYFTNIDRYGNVITSWGTNKNLLTQTRNAYGFVRAYMMTGHDDYRYYADEALEFMYENAWDDAHGGWYSQLDINGNPQGATNGRSAFDAHYALLGPAAAFEAFGDSTDFEMLLQGYEHLEEVYWDDRSGFEGYFDWSTYTGSNAYDKSFNATVDAITTHLLSLFLMTGDQSYLDRLNEIADEILNHLLASMESQAIGFVEEYGSNWNWDNSETMTIMGHVLKSAWCLIRVHNLDPHESYVEGAEYMAADVLNLGYDHDFGGPYKDYNRQTGEMLMWGNPDTAKAWWQMEQAITAGMQLWSATGDEQYLEMADETLSFFMEHFVDHVYGDVYENRTRYGDQTWGLNKGGGGKAAYHSIETGYYTYLYGSAFLTETPFDLYYWFEATDTNRIIRLQPFSAPANSIMIAEVDLEGVVYDDFNASEMTLNIPAGVGGEFKVTFFTSPTAIEGTVTRPAGPNLLAAYPNPFNAQSVIRMHVQSAEPVHVDVFDLQGHQIQKLFSGTPDNNELALTWNGHSEAGEEQGSGIYIIRAAQAGHSSTLRVTLLR